MEPSGSGEGPAEDREDGSAAKANDEAESAIYEQKLAKLQKYLPFLNSTIARLESSKDKVRASQLSKMKNLQQILTSSKQRMKIDTLERCEDVLKKLEEKLKFPITQDNAGSRTNKEPVKTEPEEVVESPASPPKPDLNPPKSTPIIIPVERCATVERDYSKAEQETTLEASRGRLKGLMLKNDAKPTVSVSPTPAPPAPQIPGLDLLYSRGEPERSLLPSRGVNVKGSSESDTRPPSEIATSPATQGDWKVLDSSRSSRAGMNDWPASRVDVDERRLNRDIDFRPSRRDIDERQLSESESHSNQSHPGQSLTSVFQPTVSHAMPSSSLLPRFMPTRNSEYSSITCSSSQEFQRSSDNDRLEGNSSHQSALMHQASSNIRGNVPHISSGVEQIGHPNSQSRYPVPQRESHGTQSKTSLHAAPKSFQNSFPHLELNRRNVPSTHQSPKVHPTTQGEANKPSAREKIMLRMDEVEKLGVSKSGGALRKLKSDVLERGGRKPTEVDGGTFDEDMRPELMPRIDPRLEREQRRSSMEEEVLKGRMSSRIPPLIPPDQSGFGPNMLPPTVSSYSSSSVSFGGNMSRSATWNQSHVNSRSMYQSQSVINTYQWQGTCTVKQTTAHDLGLRYQPRSRHGKGTHFSQPERSLPATSSAPSEGNLILKEAERNPRIPPMKPFDERTDSRTSDPRRKEKGQDKADKDYSSPLNNIYSHDKRSKTGQGYGLQNYRIPKRPKDQSPPKELSLTAKSTVMDPRLALTRDPRLSKVLTRPPSPDIGKESPILADCVPETSQEQSSALTAKEALESTSDSITVTVKSSHFVSTSSNSPSLDKDEERLYSISCDLSSSKGLPDTEACSDIQLSQSIVGSLSPPHSKSRCSSPEESEKFKGKSHEQLEGVSRSEGKVSVRASRSRDKSPLHSHNRNRSTSKAHSRERSRSRSRSKGRGRSKSSSYEGSRGRDRSWTRSRSRSRSRAKSRGSSPRRREKSRGRSSSRGRCKSRGRSCSRTRNKSRGRSPSRNRCRSRGRSASKSRGRSRGRDRDRSLSRLRGKSRGRSISRSRGRSRGRSTSRTRNRKSASRGRRRSRMRSLSREQESCTSRVRGRAGSRNRSPSRSNTVTPRRSSSRTRLQSKEDSYQSRRKHSPHRDKDSPSYLRESRSRKSRNWSQSSDSDKNSESWSRKESLSPDRGHAWRGKNRHRSRKRSVSSGSNQSRDLSSVRSHSSTCKSQNISKSRDLSSKRYESGKRSLSRESSTTRHKSAASSRSSSCSGRSSPLFPKERSQSKSPYRNQDFDSLLKKDVTSDQEIPQSLGDMKDSVAQSVQRDVVVSSSLNVSGVECKLSSSSDVTVDVPTSTSEIIPDVMSKPDTASSSDNSAGISSAQASSTSKQEGGSADAGNLIVGLIKSLASKDILIELAELAASQLPEDKRAQVLQLFKEGSQANKGNEEMGKNDSIPSTSADKTANISKDQTNEISNTPSAVPLRPIVKGGKRKPKGKVKTVQGPVAHDSQKKSENIVERSEKQKKKRNELEKLHEDIREMFISQEVVHATGQRSCRMRKEAKEAPVTTPNRPSSADEKLKASSSQVSVVDLSDDSPSKTTISDSSVSDIQPADSKRKKIIKYSSESDDEDPASKFLRPEGEASQSNLKMNRMSFPESESESESNSQDKQKLLPRVLLEDMQPSRPVRRNVAKRGRRIATVSRDQFKGNEDDFSVTFGIDGDGDDEEEESRVEDKDMSQIDTSNIIQVEGAGSKLTRNQLKRLKDPDQKVDLKSDKKRPLYGYKELSESESDTSKTSESLLGKSDLSGVFDSSPSPIKKKRKLRKTQNIPRNTAQQNQNIEQISLDDDLDFEFPEGSTNEGPCMSSPEIKIAHSLSEGMEGNPQTNINWHGRIDVEMPELSFDQSGESLKSEYHKDLTYTVPLPNEKAFCKICQYSGKPIVNHYVSSHPMEEVLISRLPDSLAVNLKAEASHFNGDIQLLVSKYHVAKRSSGALKCRVCSFVAQSSINLYEHVSSHTGEYRYSCTQCAYKTFQRMSMKSHRKSRHNKSKVADLCRIFIPDAVANMKILFAYICSECNFFQLQESNVKKHVQSHHPSTAQVTRICISEEVPSELKDAGGRVGKVEELVVGNMVNEHGSQVSHKVSASMTMSEMLSDIPSVENFVESSLKDAPLHPSSTGSNTSPLDMSVFIGSDHPCEDESQVEQKRRKLLEDAEEKIRGRPKIRGCISEKLSQRLQSEPSPSIVGSITSLSSSALLREDEVTVDHDSSEKLESPEKFNLKTTGGRAASKSCDPFGKRFTRSTSRTSVTTTDSEITPTISSAVPDEVKAPLPVSILSDTLQRMQETLQDTEPSVTSTSSVVSPLGNSTVSKFVLKKGAVKVGRVEAKTVDETQEVVFICSFPDCSFSSGQTFLFQEHIDKHAIKLVSAPCSICGDGGNILRDLRSSFDHLLKYHLYEVDLKDIVEGSSHPPPPIPLDSSQVSVPKKLSLIRLRKLPGDVLSQSDKTSNSENHQGLASDDPTSLVISSVISLSKNHTPDGLPLQASTSHAAIASHPIGFNSSSIEISAALLSKFSIQYKKDRASMREMMRPEKVCHLFKCYGQHCSFSTNLKEFFADHYHKHLSKELHQSVRAASETFQWQKCLYCEELKGSGKDLANHILLSHDGLKYQCSGCFYRAASVASVVFHQKNSHQGEVVVYECYNLSSGAALEKGSHRLQMSQINQIQVYKCIQDSGRGPCGTMFVSSENFLSHQQSVHPSDKVLYCNECGVGFDCPSELIRHYSTSHSYRMYHCLHCSKSSETLAEISCHMCVDHPEKLMQVAARIPISKLGSIQETIQLPSGVFIGLMELGNELSHHPTIPAPKDCETDFDNDPLLSDKELLSPCTSFDIGANAVWSSNSQSDPLSLPPPCGNNSFKEDGVSNEMAQMSGCKDSEAYLFGGKQQDRCSRVVDSFSKNDGGAIGLLGSSLFQCGFLGCSYKADTSALFKEHMLSCELSHTTLSCPHCSKVCRNPSVLIEHLPKHGVPRFMCGLCGDFRTTHQNGALRHAKDKHKLSPDSIRFIQNPLREEPGTSPLIFCAKENTPKKSKPKLQNAASSKMSFGPTERDMLPLSAVFTSNVTCSVCQYSTKVRSNMFRHLDQHALGSEPSPVPVLNPVPCLERNEKMFDTMTNHAISSTIPVRRDSNAFKVIDEPKFVAENQRFVCCAPACHQISSDEAMLRHHIRVLHPEILVYKCPHCPDSDVDGKQPIHLEKLGNHLKMHGSRLYSCLSCTYYHYHRFIVERHTGEKHPDQKLIRIVREPKPDGPSDMENVIDGESEILGATSVHRTHTTYKCSLCNFRANARSRISSHFAKSHPHDKEDVIEVVQKIKMDKAPEDNPQLMSESPALPPVPIVEPLSFDSTPLWSRNSPRVRHLRGILFEEHGLKPKEMEHSDTKTLEAVRLKRPIQSSIDNVHCNKREKKDVLSCGTCSKKFPISQEEDYRAHMRSHISNSESLIKCPECTKTFYKHDNLVSHVRNEHKQNITAAGVVSEQINLSFAQQSSEISKSVQGILPSPVNDPVNIITKVAESITIISPSKPQSVSKRKSPRTISAISSLPSMDCSSIQPRKPGLTGIVNKSAVEGIKPLHNVIGEESNPLSETNRLQHETFSTASEQVHQNVEDPHKILSLSKPKTSDPSDNSDADVEVDESALELDIEEVDDEEVCLGESAPRDDKLPSVFSKEPLSSTSSDGLYRGIECKYKSSHGCTFVCKSKTESSYHEKKHWEVQPLKCGHCDYQAVRESYIRMHSVKKHPGLPVQLIKNKLPEIPTILHWPRQQFKKSSIGTSPKSNNVSSEERAEEIMRIAELADDEEIFKSVNVLRCGYCRLRETSLSRLFSHWQSCHKDNTTLLESLPDGRRLVPFKFREVKVGDHEKATMAFRCALCSSKGTVKLLAEHYPSRHPGERIKISELIHNRVQCVLCPRQFSSKTALNSHFLSAHPGEAVSSQKVNAQDISDDLDRCMGCLYCMEPVKTASDMKDHHLNFHSHLDPKFIELEALESCEPIPSEKINADCSQSDVDQSGQSVVNTANSNRPSVILSVGSVSQEDPPQIPDAVSIDLPPTLSTVIKRTVARKSTSKVRAVARKSTGGVTGSASINHNTPLSRSSSDSDSADGDEGSLDENAVSSPLMVEGVKMRVSLETLCKYSDLYPDVVLNLPADK